VSAALGVQDPDGAPTVLVLAADGRVKGVLQGRDLAARTMQALG
jgi:hypothetical protein